MFLARRNMFLVGRYIGLSTFFIIFLTLPVAAPVEVCFRLPEDCEVLEASD